MNDSIVHRGPDGDGLYFGEGIGLAHRRLSIIDLEGGAQPIYNEDRSVVVVYNGEIYNFVSLMEELKGRGHTFRTHCDTEVIVHAWEEWGEKCVDRFRGMFVFALWDARQNLLFLARDRLGIKPLYYSISNGTLLFASELKALMQSKELDREIDESAVEEYFAFGYVPDPKTIFRNTFKLAPGHTICVSPGNESIEQKRYWDISFEQNYEGSADEATQELLSLLGEAVQLRMIADVPLGAFLSGGVDSSAVVAMMAAASDSPVITNSISFGEKDYNESSHAERVADLYHTDHLTQAVDSDDYSLLSKLSGIYDEPFADSSAMPTYRVCELARSKVTVALSGDGGDENFAGYRRYRWFAFEEKFRRVIPGTFREPLFSGLGAIYPKADWAPRVFRAKTTLQAIGRSSIEGYFHGVSITTRAQRHLLFNQRFRGALAGYSAIEVFDGHAKKFDGDDTLSLVQYLDFKTYLPGDILTKVDRASMAHSLEVRVPVLDHKFVEWVSALPTRFKLNGREGKYIFKKALESLLPNEILYRPKMGFAVPLGKWFRGPLNSNQIT
jgi:asparagine synthase (glutamine-hydrolysing)